MLNECVSAALQSTDCLSQPGGEKEREKAVSGDSGRAELICMRRASWANGQTGQREYQDPTGSDVSGYTLLLPFLGRVRERSREKEGASRVEVNGPSSRLILAV